MEAASYPTREIRQIDQGLLGIEKPMTATSADNAASSDEASSSQHFWRLRRRDQLLVASVVALSLLLVAWKLNLLGEPGVAFDEVAPQPAEFRLDINSADWPELCLLPGVGESLAHGIVANRAARGPFRSHEDLLRVPKLGPKTLAGIRPYLLSVKDLRSDTSNTSGEQ